MMEGGGYFWTGAVGPQLGDVGANLYTPLGTCGLAQLYTRGGRVNY